MKGRITLTGLQGVFTKTQADILNAIQAAGEANLRMIATGANIKSLQSALSQVERLVSDGYLKWVN